MFETPWGSHNGSDIAVYKGELDPEGIGLIADGLNVDDLIYMENTGETDLVFYAGLKSDENPGIPLSPGEESTLYLSEIGEGDTLSVQNLNSKTIGQYSVKI